MNNNKKYNILKFISFLMLMTCIFIFTGCTSKDTKSITIYYPNFDSKNYDTYLTRDITLESNDKIELLEKVKDALLMGIDSNNEDYKNPYNDIVKISYVTLDKKLLIVNFEGDYYALSNSERLQIRIGICKSYSSFTFIESIRFLLKGNMLIDEYGEKLNDINIDNIILDMEDNETINNISNYNLYFGTSDGKMLYREERALEMQSSTLLAKELLQELIKGPSIEGLYQAVPKQTKIRQLEIKDGICYVDLSKEFATKHQGGKREETLTIYSIVNTLTELPEIEKVQFLIDGEKKDEYQGYYEFSNPFVRDSSLIREENKKDNVSNPDNVIKILTEKEMENLKNNTSIDDILNDSNNDKNKDSNEETLDDLVKAKPEENKKDK